MIKSLMIASLMTSALFIASAQAQQKAIVCDEAQISVMEKGAANLTDVAKREAAMKSSATARSMLTKKDMEGCMLHMQSHIKDFGSGS
jgi:hypothetical protein